MTTLLRGSRLRVLVGLLVLVVLAPNHANGQNAKELDGSAIDERTYRSFYSNFRKYARFACAYEEGGYGVIPAYDRRKESSLGMSVNEVLEEHSEETTRQVGALVTRSKRTPPREDALAYVRALPEAKVGEYGYVASAEVLHVIDSDEMIVTELWLIDRDALRAEYEREEKRSAQRNGGRADRDELNFNYVSRIELRKRQESSRYGMTGVFRLVGYSTRGIRPGVRWKGPDGEGFQVGVMAIEASDRDEFEGLDKETRRKIGSGDRLVLSELSKTMRVGLDEEGFKKLLDARGMTVQDFVDVVHRLRQEDRRNADDLILQALLPPEED